MMSDSLKTNKIQTLADKIKTRQAVVGIVGLGYVGLPLVLRFAEEGFKVMGLDVDQSKVDALNAGRSYIAHISADKVQAARTQGFEATTDMRRAQEADALILCVPTPLGKQREPDLSFVVNTVEALVPHMRKGQLLSLESTTYPGTTDEELKPRLEQAGFTAGEDVFLVYSPEREDPANPDFNTRNIPKICAGITEQCLQLGLQLYGQVVDQAVPVSSTRTAEMTKLLENIHRAVNIGLANEMKMVADRMGIDIYEVIQAAATKPFGFVPYYPGPGLGGHCMPIDPFYLTWKAREYGVNTRFIELAGEVNRNMPAWVLGKLADALNDRGKAIRGSNILLLGIAYKKNVGDMRESPAAVIMELLRDRGAELSYHDPHVPRFPAMREHAFDLDCQPLTPESLASADCVLLTTDHAAVDYAMVTEHAQLIVDTRGVYKNGHANVVAA